jgi:hypothetical protein
VENPQGHLRAPLRGVLDSFSRPLVEGSHRHSVADVIDDTGTSVKERYLLDCCYILEAIQGIDANVNQEKVRSCKHIKLAVERFRSLGIDASDSSVFHYADAERFKFIGIQMRS